MSRWPVIIAAGSYTAIWGLAIALRPAAPGFLAEVLAPVLTLGWTLLLSRSRLIRRAVVR